MTIQEALLTDRPFKRSAHPNWIKLSPDGFLIWDLMATIPPSPTQPVWLTKESLLATDWDFLPIPPPAQVISMIGYKKKEKN